MKSEGSYFYLNQMDLLQAPALLSPNYGEQILNIAKCSKYYEDPEYGTIYVCEKKPENSCIFGLNWIKIKKRSHNMSEKNEIGCLNKSADIVNRINRTWSDTNLDSEFKQDNLEFERLICTCGNLTFEILITGDYETAGRCIKCGKYYLVHCG